MQDKVGGIALVHLWVDDLGKLEHVRVLREIGNGLDEKAVEAVKQHKFNPAMDAEK
jgi:periplasmic protein TonB